MHLKNQLKATIYRMSFNIKLHSLMKFHGRLLETKCIIFPGAIKMATSQTAPCLSAKTGIPHLTLPIVAHSSEILVDLNEFYSFIKQHYKDSDKKGVPRRNTIRAEVMKYDHGIVNKDSSTYLSTGAILRYCFFHLDDFSICKIITDDVTKALLNQKKEHDYNQH